VARVATRARSKGPPPGGPFVVGAARWGWVARVAGSPGRPSLALIDCPHCGKRISARASLCSECGGEVAQPSAEASGLLDRTGTGPESGRIVEPLVTAPPEGDGWSRFPTWLLFSLWFVGGSVILVAGIFAVVVLVGAVVDATGDSDAASNTAGGSSAVTTVSVVGSGLMVGECLTEEELERYLVGDDFSVAACSDPHDYEVYVVHGYPAGAYPGEEAVSDELYDVCLGEFEGYVGRDYDSSALDFYRLWPEEGLWESGTRIGECLLFDFDGGQLTGSSYQSGW
jgi:hypothetical protein